MEIFYKISMFGRPNLKFWILIWIFLCFMNIETYASMSDEPNAITIFPKNSEAIEYGEPLELFCIINNGSSSDTEFLLKNVIIDSEIVNSTTRRLYISKPEKQLNTYYCRNNKTKKICLSRVIVDTRPEPVVNFSCISKNLDILNCSWFSPQQYSIVDYNLHFVALDRILKPPCVPRGLQNRKAYCVWNTDSSPRYRQQEETLLFHLTARNIIGHRSENFTVDHFSIVKPDPPYDLKVIEQGPHSVVLEWRIPHNVNDFLLCGVNHQIEYQTLKSDNTTYYHLVDTSNLPPRSSKYRFNLTNLPYSHMQYEVRVFIESKKAVDEQFWSDFNYIIFNTASERPRRPPETIVGAFDQTILNFNNRRNIHVYWKQIDEHEEFGANFKYKIITREENSPNIQTYFADKTESYIVLNESLNALDISIYSYNEIASSINSSHIYVPRADDALTVKSFTKVSYENGTHTLSWDSIKYVDNYTLFWCPRIKTNICSKGFDFVVLDSDKTKHFINLPRDHQYQFAISANVGSQSSGMVWANCDISIEDLDVMFRLPRKLNSDVPGKSSVTLKWELDCTLQDNVVSGCDITCPFVKTNV